VRPRIVYFVGAIAALAFPNAAVAQGMGLDLTREGPNLGPSLAIVTVGLTEQDAGLSQPVERALAYIATARGAFSRVVSEDQVRELLKGTDVPVQDCRDASCLTTLSHRLRVDRVLIAELNSGALRVVAFDWAGGVLLERTISRDALGGGNPRRLEPTVGPLLQKLSTPLGELVVTTNLDRTQIQWGSWLIGEGRSFHGTVPAGTQTVRITSPGYEPYEETVTVAPGGKAEVEAEVLPLTASTPVAEVEEEFDPKPRRRSGKSVWERPGLYAALAGAVVLSVGLAFGVAANGAGSKIQDADGNGEIDPGITRAEALAAQRNAALANVIGAVGALGMSAGVGWLVLDVRQPNTALQMGVLVRGKF
jgi:hypothetical protein